MLKIPALLKNFCDAVWEYDAVSNEVYVYYDGMTPELCGCWTSYDVVSQMYRENYVYPSDQSIWDAFFIPEKMKCFIDGKTEENHFYIRFAHTRKGVEWHEVYIQRAGEGRLLLISRDVQELQRNAAITRAVMPEFDYVCCIEAATQSYVLYYSDGDKTVVPQSASDNYHRIMEEFNRDYVVPEEREILTEKMQLENVLKELETKKEYILYATVKEKGHRAYKKLRFCYENEKKERLLLTRIDIGEVVGEQRLQEIEKAKRLQYLQNMPVAFCSIEILLDKEGNPYDFRFTYCNRAHEELEGVKEGELLGKNFYEFFEDTDPMWLNYYYETAYKGISHVIRDYSPEIRKHLLIYTFQSELGHCECVLLDVSEQHFLTQELQNSREDMKRILEMTTALVFRYYPEREQVILNGETEGEPERVLTKEELCRELLEDELLAQEYQETLEQAFVRVEKGERSLSVVIRARLTRDEKWNWYRVTMFDFKDGYTHERKVFGFLQNIDQEISREKELLKKAQVDSLTGVFNSGTGKYEIRRRLKRQQTVGECCNAMFVMDMDNFKKINDTKGHLTGDNVLVEFAKVLSRTFRKEDVIYRLGGDEFVVFAENIQTPDSCIEGILNRFYSYLEEARKNYPFLKCSMGIFVSDRPHTFEEYYEAADHALYETKNSSKGNYTIKKDN